MKKLFLANCVYVTGDVMYETALTFVIRVKLYTYGFNIGTKLKQQKITFKFYLFQTRPIIGHTI